MEEVATKAAAFFQGIFGNQVFRAYDVDTKPFGTGGPGFVWQLYHGRHKTTAERVCVFLFDKRHLEKFSDIDKEKLLVLLKRDAQTLSRIRHPHLLQVVEPLEDGRSALTFATEPVTSSMANLIGQTVDVTGQKLDNEDRDPFFLSDIECRIGILHISEALSFLHNTVHQIHMNICPATVFVTVNGHWKIAGMGHSVSNKEKASVPFFIERPATSKMSIPISPLNPFASYLAPETSNGFVTTGADVFSLACFVYELYHIGQGPPRIEPSSRSLPPMELIPASLQPILSKMFATDVKQRPSLQQILASEYFNEPPVKSIRFLSSLHERTFEEKEIFFETFLTVLEDFEFQLSLSFQDKVVPALAEQLKIDSCAHFVIPAVLWTAERTEKSIFTETILPLLSPYTNPTTPVGWKAATELLCGLDSVLNLCPRSFIEQNIEPLLIRALGSPVEPICSLAIEKIVECKDRLDSTMIQNDVLPRLLMLLFQTPHLPIRVRSLVALNKLHLVFDGPIITDKILPAVKRVAHGPEERSPALSMAILFLLKTMASKVTSDVVATKILPSLIPLSVDPLLSIGQFNLFMDAITEMLETVNGWGGNSNRPQKSTDIQDILDAYPVPKARSTIRIRRQSSVDDSRQSAGGESPAIIKGSLDSFLASAASSQTDNRPGNDLINFDDLILNPSKPLSAPVTVGQTSTPSSIAPIKAYSKQPSLPMPQQTSKTLQQNSDDLLDLGSPPSASSSVGSTKNQVTVDWASLVGSTPNRSNSLSIQPSTQIPASAAYQKRNTNHFGGTVAPSVTPPVSPSIDNLFDFDVIPSPSISTAVQPPVQRTNSLSPIPPPPHQPIKPLRPPGKS